MARSLFTITAAAGLLILLGGVAACERTQGAQVEQGEQADLPLVTVYKSPTCGCCTVWAEYMEEEGFTVRQIDVPDIGEVRNRLGVPPMLGSCHTAVVGDYLVEGHVPAGDVRRLLAEQPDGKGISVPGMPIGSPGMEIEGRPAQAYETYLFTEEGQASVFARH
jgi:hypothetical protein